MTGFAINMWKLQIHNLDNALCVIQRLVAVGVVAASFAKFLVVAVVLPNQQDMTRHMQGPFAVVPVVEAHMQGPLALVVAVVAHKLIIFVLLVCF